MNDALVLGAGIAGLSIANELTNRGWTVTIVADPKVPATSLVAAGMLAPGGELTYGEDWFAGFQSSAATYWQTFAQELERDSGFDVVYERRSTLLVAATRGDLGELDRLYRYHLDLGMSAEMLTSTKVGESEPTLAPRMAGGLLLPGDAQVDNRRVVEALTHLLVARNVTFVAATVTDVSLDHGDPTVQLADASQLRAPHVVVAMGTGNYASGESTNFVHPVRGVTIRGNLLSSLQLPSACIRGQILGRAVYLVPRRNGEIVIGATAEEGPITNYRPRVREVYDLLHDAGTILPSLSELEITDVSVGYRPATTDNLPIVGPDPKDPRLLYHTGHYRHGILLSPYTASLLADHMEGKPSDRLDPLAPGRFTHNTKDMR
jgi:glycine oxidase